MSYLAFLDFETTGLDPEQHEPIEVAVVVTDDRFVEVAAGEWLIRPSAIATWHPEARRMHETSGLARLCEEQGLSRALVGGALSMFLRAPALRGETLHPAGNSVHFDRTFLKHYFPDVDRMFHHRHLDVSSIRMLGERLTSAPPLSGEKPHRAMQDVRRSIAELAYWTRAIRNRDLRPDLEL